MTTSEIEEDNSSKQTVDDILNKLNTDSLKRIMVMLEHNANLNKVVLDLNAKVHEQDLEILELEHDLKMCTDKNRTLITEKIKLKAVIEYHEQERRK